MFIDTVAAHRGRTERAYREETDETLLCRSRDGDRLACTVLLQRYQDELRARCRRYLRNAHDQDELLQEVMIKVWRCIGAFDERASFRSWTYRIVHNAAVDEYRRRDRNPTPVDPTEQEWHTDDSPERTVVGESHVRWAMSQMPRSYQVASMLADRLGYPGAEIAELCGIPEATVRTRVFRARRALRATLSLDAAA